MEARTPLKRRLLYTTLTIVAFIGLFFFLHRLGWQRIGDSILKVGWASAFLILFFEIAQSVFDAQALKKATGDKAPLSDILWINQVGAISNNFVPADGGEVLKISLLTSKAPGQAVAAVVIWNVAFKLSRSLVSLALAGYGLAFIRSREAFLVFLSGFSGILLYFLLNGLLSQGWTGKIFRFLPFL